MPRGDVERKGIRHTRVDVGIDAGRYPTAYHPPGSPSMRFFLVLATSLVAAGCATGSAGRGAAAPRDGTALLQRMHDRYAGRWFQTLTFVQKTVSRRPDGTEQVSTWYEAQRGPRLRIDMGDPSAGNGAHWSDGPHWARLGQR